MARGEWMERELAQPFYGRVECGSPISSWLIAFINKKLIPLIFMCKCTNVYMDFIVDMFMIFIFLLCWLYVCLIIAAMYGSQDVLLVNEWIIYLWPNR